MTNKKLIAAVTLAVCIVISLFVAIRVAKAQTDAQVSLTPASIAVEPCNDFFVDVIVDVNYPSIADYDFFLNYNPNLMTAIDALNGDFLQPTILDFGWEILPNFYLPGIDAVHVWAIADSGYVGSGTLARVVFHCDGPGRTTIILEDIMLSDEGGTNHAPEKLNWVVDVDQQIPPANAWINPPDYTVPICIPFPVYVMVDVPAGYDLASFQLVLGYDTAFVDCIDIVPGDFPPLPQSVDYKLIDDGLGHIEFVVSTTSPGGSVGSGSIAKVTFHCTGAGQSILTISSLNLFTSQGWQIPAVSSDGRVVQVEYWEPLKLQHLVELPYPYHLSDLPFAPPGSPEGYAEIKAELEAKGYVFDVDYGGGLYNVDSFFDVYFEPGSEPFEGQVTSWWSSNTLEDGTRACMLSCELEDGSSIAMGFVTNLLPPEQIPEVDPYIIVNAQPYLFVRFYWWAWTPLGRIVTWSYWWYDSHSHPNWFWKPYYWWRTYTKSYYYPYTDVPYWRPWWSWWWHWVYWKHWNWWCTYFPYDP
ncbi:hypothetical protein GTO27_01040 [Candidatus Bathyarchaeota archaeon]|nr:hypothetical protein [Candidatus Bathyarchaeota archaeon]